MWHTVEFSRFGRAPHIFFRSCFGATLLSYTLYSAPSTHRAGESPDWGLSTLHHSGRVSGPSFCCGGVPTLQDFGRASDQLSALAGPQLYITQGALATIVLLGWGCCLRDFPRPCQSCGEAFPSLATRKTLRVSDSRVKSRGSRACRAHCCW